MIKKSIITLIILLICLLLDQITKNMATMNYNILKEGIYLFDYLNLVYVENRGVSFGFFAEHDKSFYFGILSIIISIYILYLIYQSGTNIEVIGLSLILSGALGNGFDRINHQYVIDFIDFHFQNYHWPAFNFADSFISIGAILFVISLVKNPKN
jgi:signal peptidase II